MDFLRSVYSISIEQVNSQMCVGMAQYDRCSPNLSCGCFQLAGTNSVGICADQLMVHCSELVSCDSVTNLWCPEDHRCVHHPKCSNHPICHPIPKFNQQLCPPLSGKII